MLVRKARSDFGGRVSLHLYVLADAPSESHSIVACVCVCVCEGAAAERRHREVASLGRGVGRARPHEEVRPLWRRCT